jgi:outer membrane lipoprotein-sorting protein
MKTARLANALFGCLLAALLTAWAASGQAPPGPSLGERDRLAEQIWTGVQEAQRKYWSGCGTITETRISKLLAKPLVFHGKFCASGLARFALEYTEPERIRIRFNGEYLNVSTGPRAAHTEVIRVGQHVRRTQAYFSKENSLENLRRNFAISTRENGKLYELRLVPRSERFRSRVNEVVVKFRKEDFLLRSLEIDGKSGVKSVFAIEISALNVDISEENFKVYRPN